MSAADLAARIEALAQRWAARARSSHPADAMLINRHVRELREVTALPMPRADAPVCDGILRHNADLTSEHATLGAPEPHA